MLDMVQPGQDFLWPGMGENREVTIVEVGSGEGGQLGSKAGEGEVELGQTIGGSRGELPRGAVQEVGSLRAAIDPRDIQRRRPDEARFADSAKDAEITTDPLQWASAPDRYDFPGVDTGPTFREAEGDDFDTGSLLDSLF